MFIHDVLNTLDQFPKKKMKVFGGEFFNRKSHYNNFKIVKNVKIASFWLKMPKVTIGPAVLDLTWIFDVLIF